ncbi:MAG: YdeI/OmpD-associated family protein [Saprospiraceae bacterium]
MRKVKFNALLERFERNKEKTGWTYIYIPKRLATKMSEVKIAYRVKGKLDDYEIKQVALLPMGDGDFIMPINGEMRKNLNKMEGDTIEVVIELDPSELLPDQDFIDALSEVPNALDHYEKFSQSHKNYFTKWLSTAKTIETKANRIAMAVDALGRGLRFDEMLREKKGTH